VADHPIRCACGALAGILRDPPWSNRVICYCKSCQAFAERLGRGDDVLDAQGGSDVVQTSPRSLAFTRGREHLACMRLTPKGPLRWYASCCNTPIGNTSANFRLSFIGLLHSCLGDRATVDAAFGPPRMHVFTKFAKGEPKPKQQIPIPAILGFLGHVTAAHIGGGYKVTPFFDASGAPVAAPDDSAMREASHLGPGGTP
jgi:hypothetical protein